MATDGGKALTYNRMEAKPIAGEHCRFCGREQVPLVKTRCCEQWICCDTAFMSFRVAIANLSMRIIAPVISTTMKGIKARCRVVRSVADFLEKTNSNDAVRGREMSRCIR